MKQPNRIKTMVRNFGERRGKKKGKKSKSYKGPKGVKETEEVSSQEVAMYDPSEAKAKVEGSSRQKHTYRSQRTERQRGKKDRSKDDSANYDYTDDEDDEDEDDLDFGGEYDEIIRTGPARREAREAREAEQLINTTVTFIDVGAPPPRRQEYGTSRRGRRGHLRHDGGRRARSGYGGYDGYSGGGGLGLVRMAEFSMIDLIMTAIADRFSI